jgi:hypothetical protein
MPLLVAASDRRGGTNIDNNEKNDVRRYLLGQLGEADEDRLELQLLTDPAFGREFDTIVDEITDQYVNGEFQGEECERVQQYFLKSPERRAKAQFAAALIDRAGAGQQRVIEMPARRERWWFPQSLAFRFAATAAIVVIAVGLGYLAFRDRSTPKNFAFLELTISSSERAEGTESKRLHLASENDAVKIFLHLPEQSSQYTDYRVELIGGDGVSRLVEVTEKSKQAVTVTIPASELARGRYALHVFWVKPDGKQERISGSYLFTVE